MEKRKKCCYRCGQNLKRPSFRLSRVLGVTTPVPVNNHEGSGHFCEDCEDDFLREKTGCLQGAPVKCTKAKHPKCWVKAH